MVLGTAGRRIGPEVKPSQALYRRGGVCRGGEAGKLLRWKAINIRIAVTAATTPVDVGRESRPRSRRLPAFVLAGP